MDVLYLMVARTERKELSMQDPQPNVDLLTSPFRKDAKITTKYFQGSSTLPSPTRCASVEEALSQALHESFRGSTHSKDPDVRHNT
jgi:hypothetical protein